MTVTIPSEETILKAIRQDWEKQLSKEMDFLVNEAVEKLNRRKPAMLAEMVTKIMSYYDYSRDGQNILIRVLNETKP